MSARPQPTPIYMGLANPDVHPDARKPKVCKCSDPLRVRDEELGDYCFACGGRLPRGRR